mgnify:CR=1 FL=1
MGFDVADCVLLAQLPPYEPLRRKLERAVVLSSEAVPADVAAAVVWFVSDANSYCSGQKLNIDGAGQATFR